MITNAFSRGNAGSIAINAKDSLILAEIRAIKAIVGENATLNGGNIAIETKKLTLDDSSQISVVTFGEGNAGAIIVEATDSRELLNKKMALFI